MCQEGPDKKRLSRSREPDRGMGIDAGGGMEESERMSGGQALETLVVVTDCLSPGAGEGGHSTLGVEGRNRGRHHSA